MKKLVILFAAALSLLACRQAPTPIKVMTFNVRVGKANDHENSWQYRRKAAADMILDQHPAVFGVQEAVDFQLEYILEQCPMYKCVGVGREDGIKDGEHMSVFYDTTRIALKDWGTYWLSETPDEPSKGWDAACRRTATWTLLKDLDCNREFFFVNTHLDHIGQEARRNGLALIVERIGKMNPDGFPMILTGDFNVFPDDPCLTDLRAIMSDVWETAPEVDEGPTWHDWGKGTDTRHIDYIFYSGYTKCTSLVRLTKSYDNVPFVSDHYPVIAVLE